MNWIKLEESESVRRARVESERGGGGEIEGEREGEER